MHKITVSLFGAQIMVIKYIYLDQLFSVIRLFA